MPLQFHTPTPCGRGKNFNTSLRVLEIQGAGYFIAIVFRAFLLARIKRRYGICLRKRLQPLLAHVKTTVRFNAPQEVNDLTSYRLNDFASLF